MIVLEYKNNKKEIININTNIKSLVNKNNVESINLNFCKIKDFNNIKKLKKKILVFKNNISYYYSNFKKIISINELKIFNENTKIVNNRLYLNYKDYKIIDNIFYIKYQSYFYHYEIKLIKFSSLLQYNKYLKDIKNYLSINKIKSNINIIYNITKVKKKEEFKKQEELKRIKTYSYKYDFNIPVRNDNEIRLIYYGTLRNEENILEIIEEFQKIHKERPEVVLKIVYGKIHGNKDFRNKVNAYIKNGVKGITFKHNLSHKDACYEIATSDIGICWRKNGWGDNGELSTKVKEYEIYDICVCKTIKDLYIYKNVSSIINKKIEKKNIIILNFKKNNNLYVKTISNSSNNSPLHFFINNEQLPESNILLSNKYITPNYIDSALFSNLNHIYIYGKNISHIIFENISFDRVNIENDYQYFNITNNITYKNDKIFLNNIAFIGDLFTFNSLNDIINIEYISKKDINKIDVTLYDFLLCESTWHGIDNSWSYAFNLYNKNKYSEELKKVILKFKQNNKKCIFYNKEDPTNYEKFYNSAELFDIIITTSKNCVEKYKTEYPNKIILNLPFLCNPILHNPINNKKEKFVYFIGGFYKNFTDRIKNTNKLFKDVIKKYNLIIINRHYFFPKLTRQINRFKQYKYKYEIEKEFKQFEKPCVSHKEAINIYKKSLFHLNINTVTDCKTMSSRRLVELLGCGCNILSNPSKMIEYLELPVFTDIKQIKEYDIMNEYNLKGFYKIHRNYSYISFLKKIFLLININEKKTIHIKINCKDIKNIPKKYESLLKSTKFNFELLLNKDNYYNTEIIDKLLVYPYFFDGNVCFTKDKNKYFKVDYNIIEDTSDCVIKYHDKYDNKTLYIPYIYNMLYKNCFSYIPHYDTININDNINTNSILVVMCLWKRIHYLKQTLKYLESQNIDKPITLCIWNNNKDSIDEINKIINDFNGKKVKVIIHHSQENIGGIGRFILTKYICENKYNFKNVIFIDDDQIFKNNCIKILLNNVKEKESYHWSGKKFYKDRGYWNCWSNIWPKLRNDIDNTNFNDNYLHYGGTGFMIINTECFLMDDFYKFNEKYKFIEDLWMSHFVINKLGYKLQNGKELKNKVKIIQGENKNSIAQVKLLKPLKDEFLNVLREDGEWNV